MKFASCVFRSDSLDLRIITDNDLSVILELGKLVSTLCDAEPIWVAFTFIVINWDCCNDGRLTYSLTVSRRYGKRRTKLIVLEEGTLIWNEHQSSYEISSTNSTWEDEDTSFNLLEYVSYFFVRPSKLSRKCMAIPSITPLPVGEFENLTITAYWAPGMVCSADGLNPYTYYNTEDIKSSSGFNIEVSDSLTWPSLKKVGVVVTYTFPDTRSGRAYRFSLSTGLIVEDDSDSVIGNCLPIRLVISGDNYGLPFTHDLPVYNADGGQVFNVW